MDNNQYVGHIYPSVIPYFDKRKRKMSTKGRPVLILKSENDTGDSDFLCLPVSKVSVKKNLNPYYDVEINNQNYSDLTLKEPISYIRCHKCFTLNKKEIRFDRCFGNVMQYTELYASIIEKVKAFIIDL